MGIALGIKHSDATNPDEAQVDFENIFKTLGSTRPTAVNLFWALERMKNLFGKLVEEGVQLEELKGRLIEEAIAIQKEDIESNMNIGKIGQELMPSQGTILTHCNAGALATAGYGTALGVIRAAVNEGKKINVLADETRPFLQGARLTAWELWKDNIDVKVISDNMSGTLMLQGLIDCVIVGADRIAANGDVANKVGTYTVAILAAQHKIPFYVAAPVSTLDLSMKSGSEIPIEERDPSEVTSFNGSRIVPEEVSAFNPAFDVTPNEFVSAIITDRGIARKPYIESLAKLAVGTRNSGTIQV